jgi:hypothetical protein
MKKRLFVASVLEWTGRKQSVKSGLLGFESRSVLLSLNSPVQKFFLSPAQVLDSLSDK